MARKLLYSRHGTFTRSQAALGADIDIPTLEQPQRLKIPEGSQSGTQLRLRHKGVPALNGGPRGDLIVHLDVRTPTRLTREQRRLLEELRDSLPVDNAPAEKGLFEKVKLVKTSRESYLSQEAVSFRLECTPVRGRRLGNPLEPLCDDPFCQAARHYF